MDKHQIEFHGKPLEFFGIWIVNILFTILTLGIYSAWAKVRTNRYMYGNTVLDKDPFHYLATPEQIFIGRVIVIGVLWVWFIAQSFAPLLAALMFVAFIVFLPVLLVRNLRFDMRMTQYRNVRFDFNADYKQAYIVFLGLPVVLNIATIALFALVFGAMTVTPWAAILFLPVLLVAMPYLSAIILSKTADFVVNNSRYGNLEFNAEVETSVYFRILLKTAALGLGLLVVAGLVVSVFAGISMQLLTQLASGEFSGAVFGAMIFGYAAVILISVISNAFFAVQVRNYLFSRTKLDETLQLSSSMRTLPYVGLILSNFLLLALTLGLATPWTKIRKARYLAACSGLEGDLGLAHAKALPVSDDNSVADELTEALDLEVGIV